MNGVELGFGNVSDDHCVDRAEAVKKVLTALNIPFTFVRNSLWSYVDEFGL